MKRRIYQVDAFTDHPYGGNPAGIVPEAEGLSAAQMQRIAQEMNLSETAFVLPGGDGYDAEVRFFTPVEEVDLCGHATIATFHLLKELSLLPAGKTKLIQKTKAGCLDIILESDGSILMRQAAPQRIQVYSDAAELAAAMGAAPEVVGLPGVLEAPESWSTGLPDIMLPLRSLSALKALRPDMTRLSALSSREGVTGVHAFSFDDTGMLWCRNFAPACGIPEEAATGTSNGALGACLHHHGWHREGTTSYVAHQGDWMGRPSRISVSVHGSDVPEVWVGGRAVTVIEGWILVPPLML